MIINNAVICPYTSNKRVSFKNECVNTLCHPKCSKYSNSHISDMSRVAASIGILSSIIGPVAQPYVLTYEGQILDEVNYNERGGVAPAKRSQVLQIHR